MAANPPCSPKSCIFCSMYQLHADSFFDVAETNTRCGPPPMRDALFETRPLDDDEKTAAGTAGKSAVTASARVHASGCGDACCIASRNLGSSHIDSALVGLDLDSPCVE